MKKLILMFSLLICTNIFLYQKTNAQCHPDDWTALKALYEDTDGDNWTNKEGWEDIIAPHDNPPLGCNLDMLFGVEVDKTKYRVVAIDFSGRMENTFDLCSLNPNDYLLHGVKNGNPLGYKFLGNNLNGTIPAEIELLSNLQTLVLVNDNLTGSIPDVFESLESLSSCLLFGNKLSGSIPSISSSLNCLAIQENYFTCDETSNVDQSKINKFNYSPQLFTHSIDPFIVNEGDDINIDLSSSIETLICSQTNMPNHPRVFKNQTFGPTEQGFIYFWKKNNLEISGEDKTRLELQITEPIDAGIYTLHAYDNLLNIEFISDPIYVIFPGYDFFGQPVEYDQIMVEFKDSRLKEIYESDILYANAGSVIDSCNCNREIYLWQFPADSLAAKALVEIDKHVKKLSNDDGEVDGGSNNILEMIEISNSNTQPYLVTGITNSNQDEVIVYILDTGLDLSSVNSSFMYEEAPYDECYTDVEPASAYSYIDGRPISSNYTDEVWHGTFGYDIITEGLDLQNNIKIVPLKIFDGDGRGNLFDLTCAIYHAIDHDADIINISAGYKGQYSSILERAINHARENNVLVCSATGNDYDEYSQYPAEFSIYYHYIYDQLTQQLVDSIQYNHVISVASLDSINEVSTFSNVGNCTTLFANGENIKGKGKNNETLSASGTSMATFLVSRELAKVITENNNGNYQLILNDFENSLVPYNNPQYSSLTGKRLNINLESDNNRMAETAERFNKTNITELNAAILSNNTLNLSLQTIVDGMLYIKLFDVNGRLQNNLELKKLKQDQLYNFQFKLNQKSKTTGFYFLQLQFKTNNDEVIYFNKKIINTK